MVTFLDYISVLDLFDNGDSPHFPVPPTPCIYTQMNPSLSFPTKPDHNSKTITLLILLLLIILLLIIIIIIIIIMFHIHNNNDDDDDDDDDNDDDDGQELNT